MNVLGEGGEARKVIDVWLGIVAYSFFAYTAHWWTDTEGSLEAAREEMPAGYDLLMQPVIDNIPVLVVVLVLTFPVAILTMRLAERLLKKKLSC